MVVSMPIPKQFANCTIPHVTTKTVTAYVLKPPPPVVEHPTCPIAPVPKCEQLTQEQDSVSRNETTNADERKPTRVHRRHHRRYRAYWR
jgi:hypothetical protein